MVIKTCKCGAKFETNSPRRKLCDECRIRNRKYHDTVYMKNYIKTNRQALTIAKEDNDALEIISMITKLSKAKIIHMLIEEVYGEKLFPKKS